MVFDPNRWPKPYPMLSSPKRIAVGVLAFVSGVVLLVIVLMAFAD